MTHLVSVGQLQAQTGKSFLNVEEGYGTIGVWGSLSVRHTYLARNETNFYLQQFDNQKSADEWLAKFDSSEWKITKL